MIRNQNIRIAGIVFALVAITAIVSWQLASAQSKSLQQATQEEYQLQENRLQEAARVLQKNEADATVDRYVSDCSTKLRNRFDENLNALATLSAVELSETELLFEACADYFADKKQAQLVGFSRELAAYETLSRLNGETIAFAIPQDKITDWREFEDAHERLADLLRQQVLLQRSIITALQNGDAAQSPTVREKIMQAREITETAAVVSQQVAKVYNRLEP